MARHELGLFLASTPTAVVKAARRGRQIERDDYAGVRCCHYLEDVGANWRIKVVRISDGATTTDLIPKD